MFQLGTLRIEGQGNSTYLDFCGTYLCESILRGALTSAIALGRLFFVHLAKNSGRKKTQVFRETQVFFQNSGPKNEKGDLNRKF